MTALPPSPVPASSARPVRTSTVGPKVLTAGGIVSVLLGVLALVLAGQSFVGLLPTGVLDRDGTAGPDVLGVVEVPGTAEVVLEADTDYALHLAARRSEGDVRLAGDVVVTGPDGREVAVADQAEVSASTSRGGVRAHTVGAFETDEAGVYTLVAPSAQGGDEAGLLVVQDQQVLPFVRGIFGTVVGVMLAGLLGLLGLGMVIGGALWWRARRATAARTAAARTAA